MRKNKTINDAFPFLTTADVAKWLGVTTGRVSFLAAENGKIGRIVGNLRLFTSADVAKLAALRRPIGRPKKLSGNSEKA